MGQGEVMHYAQACALPQKVQLNRHGVRGHARGVQVKIGKVIQFFVKNHVGDIADQAVAAQVCDLPDRGGAGPDKMLRPRNADDSR